MDPSVKKKIGRRTANKIATRARLLAATRDLMMSDGFARIGPQDISDAADIGHGTFYTYFNDLEDLLQTLREDDRRELKNLIGHAVEDADDLSDAIDRIILCMVQAEIDQPMILISASQTAHFLSHRFLRRRSLTDDWATFFDFTLSSFCDETPAWQDYCRDVSLRLATMMPMLATMMAPLTADACPNPEARQRRNADLARELVFEFMTPVMSKAPDRAHDTLID